MTHWSDSARALDALASQYVLGTLEGRARRRFEAVMARRPQARERVRHWESQLLRLGQALPGQAPSAALWDRLAAQTGQGVTTTQAQALPLTTAPPATAPASAAPRRPPDAAPGWMARAMQALADTLSALARPVPAGALAFGLVAGLALSTALNLTAPADTGGDPSIPATVPASYIGVLATPDGRQGLIVASLRQAREVELKQVAPLVPAAGETLFLWALDVAGAARPVGPIPSAPFVRAPLPDTAERLFADAVELAVSSEPVGASPAAPGGAFLVRGLCGKVWPPAPATPATPAAPSR